MSLAPGVCHFFSLLKKKEGKDEKKNDTLPNGYDARKSRAKPNEKKQQKKNYKKEQLVNATVQQNE